jgi:hypothetical protein
VNSLDNAGTLKKIDATTPTVNPDEISYRYPFREGDEFVAPAQYTGWDSYQGNLRGAITAVKRLLSEVENELSTARRRPA